MSIADAVLLGVIQGLTEFLPVSSSGHLVLCEHFLSNFDHSHGLLFNVTLHMGTLLSVLVYYRRDLILIAVRLLGPARPMTVAQPSRYDTGVIPPDSPDLRYVLLIVIATIVTVLVAFPLRGFVVALFGDQDQIAGSLISGRERIRLVGMALVVTGLLLWAGERMSSGKIGRQRLGLKDALLVGVAQGFSPIPGISRSGATISAALFRGIDGVQAVRFSFLLSIPAIVAAQVYAVARAMGDSVPQWRPLELLPTLLGAIAAFAVGLLAIKIIVSSARRGRLIYFAIYCWALGGTVALFA